MAELDAMAKRQGCAVILVHHISKGVGGAVWETRQVLGEGARAPCEQDPEGLVVQRLSQPGLIFETDQSGDLSGCHSILDLVQDEVFDTTSRLCEQTSVRGQSGYKFSGLGQPDVIPGDIYFR